MLQQDKGMLGPSEFLHNLNILRVQSWRDGLHLRVCIPLAEDPSSRLFPVLCWVAHNHLFQHHASDLYGHQYQHVYNPLQVDTIKNNESEYLKVSV